MKLKISKTALFALLTAFGAGINPATIKAAQEQITQEQLSKLTLINKSIRTATDIAMYLISTLDAKDAPYKFDEIVVRLESAEVLMVKLKAMINTAISISGNTSNYKIALEKEADVVDEVHMILKKLAAILRSGLNGCVNRNGDPNMTMFVMKVRSPLQQLSAPAELNRIESKLQNLLTLMKDINTENADIINELLGMINKFKSVSGSLRVQTIEKRLPKGTPFANGQNMALASWIQETKDASLIQRVAEVTA